MSAFRLLRRIQEAIRLRTRMWVLSAPSGVLLTGLNRIKRSPIVRPGGPVVSLTTHKARIKSVHIALESIGRGKVLPSRLILWIDSKPLFEELPAAVKRLRRRGLEVRLTNNYGPHTKYYPYLESQETFDIPLVTADDDQLYPRDWLAGLVKAHNEYPDVVNCHWSLTIALDEQGLQKYRNWSRCGSRSPSFSQFALGVSGVVYPLSLLPKLKAAGTAFLLSCPKADDVWLHVQALRHGVAVRQIATKPREHLDIVGTQAVALWRENNARENNDTQIASTYSFDDIEKLRATVPVDIA